MKYQHTAITLTEPDQVLFALLTSPARARPKAAPSFGFSTARWFIIGRRIAYFRFCELEPMPILRSFLAKLVSIGEVIADKGESERGISGKSYIEATKNHAMRDIVRSCLLEA
jgi:hypothetical protein